MKHTSNLVSGPGFHPGVSEYRVRFLTITQQSSFSQPYDINRKASFHVF
jgi:hypothetical protein